MFTTPSVSISKEPILVIMDYDILSLPLTTFTLFPRLPSELRLKIWGYILHQPRLIKVITNRKHWRDPYASAGWTAPFTPTPVALHVCSESRSEALKTYELTFGSPFASPRVYIDYSIDTIRFGDGLSIEDLRRPHNLGSSHEPTDYKLDIFLGGGPHGAEGYEKVESMILDFHECLYERRDYCWNEIRLFVGLKHLTLLVCEPDYAMTQEIRQYQISLERIMRAHPDWLVPEIRIISMVSGADFGLMETSRRVQEEADD